MLIYINNIDTKTILVLPYIENVTAQNFLSTYRLPREIMLYSSQIALVDLRYDSYYFVKNRYERVDNTWQRGTILDNIGDTEFSLCTFHNGISLHGVGILKNLKSLKIPANSCEDIEEYLRCMDEIYSNVGLTWPV
jgi:hypothetical protein